MLLKSCRFAVLFELSLANGSYPAVLASVQRQQQQSCLSFRPRPSTSFLARRQFGASALSMKQSNQPIQQRLIKGKGKAGEPNAISVDDISSDILDADKYTESMQTELKLFEEEMRRQLSTKPDIRVYEQIKVKVAGEEHLLGHLSKISLKNPSLITVEMHDLEAVAAAKKALEISGMNINPQQQGSTLLIQINQSTREHRERLAKSAKVLYNKFAEKLDQIYRKSSMKIQKSSTSGITEDERSMAASFILQTKRAFAQRGQHSMENKQTELLTESMKMPKYP